MSGQGACRKAIPVWSSKRTPGFPVSHPLRLVQQAGYTCGLWSLFPRLALVKCSELTGQKSEQPVPLQPAIVPFGVTAQTHNSAAGDWLSFGFIINSPSNAVKRDSIEYLKILSSLAVFSILRCKYFQ